MTASSEFTVRDFIDLVKELNEHEAELKTKLTNAGVTGAVKQSLVDGEQSKS